MTREHAKELLPIITAFANGEDIEFKVSADQWNPLGSYNFEGKPKYYRIKPKPRVAFINEYPSGEFSTWPTREIADTNATVERIACHRVELPPIP